MKILSLFTHLDEIVKDYLFSLSGFHFEGLFLFVGDPFVILNFPRFSIRPLAVLLVDRHFSFIKIVFAVCVFPPVLFVRCGCLFDLWKSDGDVMVYVYRLGSCFCYRVYSALHILIPASLSFFLASVGRALIISLDSLFLVLLMMVGCGLVFEIPSCWQGRS